MLLKEIFNWIFEFHGILMPVVLWKLDSSSDFYKSILKSLLLNIWKEISIYQDYIFADVNMNSNKVKDMSQKWLMVNFVWLWQALSIFEAISNLSNVTLWLICQCHTLISYGFNKLTSPALYTYLGIINFWSLVFHFLILFAIKKKPKSWYAEDKKREAHDVCDKEGLCWCFIDWPGSSAALL